MMRTDRSEGGERAGRRVVLRAMRVAWVTWLAVAGCGGDGEETPNTTGRGEGGAGGAAGGGGEGGVETGPTNHDAAQTCTTVPQAGCPASHTCAVATMDGRTSCQNAGTAPRGAYCGDDYDCAPGLVCIGGLCHSQCHVAADCGSVAAACDQMFDTVTEQPIGGYLVCSTPCSPADPQNTAQDASLVGCPGGLTCYPRTTPQGATDCYAAGAVGLGGACDNDCAPGLVCLGDASGTSASCQPFCVMGVTSCNCQPFAQPQYVGIGDSILEVGYCG